MVLTKESLEQTLGFKVTNFDLYRQAFVHKSASNEFQPSFERLEFLGDSVISLVVTRWLYDSMPHEDEGVLTTMRTRLVSGKTLSALACKLELHRFVIMNERAMLAGWNKNERIAEDCFEALLGAIYLSEGLVFAREFLLTLYRTCINFTELMKNENYKDCLMRWTQAHGHPLPEYVLVRTQTKYGQKPLFEVTCTVQGVTGHGTGHTKKLAQQQAARDVLHLLGIPENYSAGPSLKSRHSKTSASMENRSPAVGNR